MTRRNFSKALEAITSRFSGTLGLAATRLDDGRALLYNESEIFPAASVVKLPLLCDALQRVERGELDLERRYRLRSEDMAGGSGVLQVCEGGLELTLRDLLTLMIVVSDNTATNMVLDVLGGVDAINPRFEAMGLQTTRVVGKLQVAWELKTELQRRGVNAALRPVDVLGLLVRLWNGEVLGSHCRAIALEILGRQQFTEMIKRYLPEGTRVATKSGQITGVRNDVGFVLTALPYAVAIASRNCRDMRYHVDNEGVLAVAQVSRLVYDFLSS